MTSKNNTRTAQDRTVATITAPSAIDTEHLGLTYGRSNQKVRGEWLTAYRTGVAAIESTGRTLFQIALALVVGGYDMTSEPTFTGSFASQVKSAATVVKSGQVQIGSDRERVAVQIGQRAAAYGNATSGYDAAEVTAILDACAGATNTAKSVQAVGQTWSAWEGTDNPEGRQSALVAAAMLGKPQKPLSLLGSAPVKGEATEVENDDEAAVQAAADANGSAWERADRAVTVLMDAWDTLTKDERKSLRSRLQSLGA